MNLQSLAWQDTCVEGLLQWAEVQTPSGWLRIKKKRLGGYLVKRFGGDLMPLGEDEEMSAEEAQAALEI